MDSQTSNKKPIIISALVLVLIIVGIVAFWFLNKKETPTETDPITETPLQEYEIIGTSVEGRPITVYTYGTGNTHLLFVGGVHGGYEWNSVLLSYQFIDYLKSNPDLIPQNLSISVIPSLNPDGIYKVIQKEGRFSLDEVPKDIETAPGRFNANNVDLNRNFDCKWKPESTWRNTTVSAGTEAFSEPESKALKALVEKQQPKAVIFWHSQANNVYASECENGILPETLAIMNAYSQASGYGAVSVFDSYEVTGDAEGWLASINIPAITVELKTRDSIEWNANLAGVNALFDYYSTQ